MVRFLTAGESHGRALVVILEGIPAGLTLDLDASTDELRRRQGGYGRGRRMAIESDRAEILSGVRRGETIGGPIAMTIQNRDWANWQHTMSLEAQPRRRTPAARTAPPVTRPRPGHADLAGVAKYGRADVRDVLERASARETAARVAAGAIARQLLAAAGDPAHQPRLRRRRRPPARGRPWSRSTRRGAARRRAAALRGCGRRARMIAEIDAAREAGDTQGGAFEVIATGVPPGLGSYVQWDRKLDGRLAQALMSIPAIKAVGIGLGPEAAYRPGSRVHDEIVPDDTGGARRPASARPTNNAGGLEGGVTNGEDLRVSAWMKPISTLMKPLRSVDLTTMTEAAAAIERSDVCAVPAAAVVGEAMVALVLADALVEKFGGDSMAELTRALASAADGALRARFTPAPRDAMIRPILRYGETALHTSAARVEQFDDGAADAAARHDRDDVRGAGRRAGGTADRRAAARLRHRPLRRQDARRADRDGQPGVRQLRRHAARRRRLPQRARLQRHRRPAGARGRARASIGTAQTKTIEGTGLLARAFQHEMDHLDGTLFVDRLRGIKRDVIVRKIQKLKRTGKW